MTPARVNGATATTAIGIGLAGGMITGPKLCEVANQIGIGMLIACGIILLVNLVIAIMITK